MTSLELDPRTMGRAKASPLESLASCSAEAWLCNCFVVLRLSISRCLIALVGIFDRTSVAIFALLNERKRGTRGHGGGTFVYSNLFLPWRLGIRIRRLVYTWSEHSNDNMQRR